MTLPLMPKATAVWLIDNTTLTFEQIARFCDLHMLEIRAMADGDVAVGMQGLNPVQSGELSADEIARCEADSSASLQLTSVAKEHSKKQKKVGRYTPLSKRQARPDAIAWLLKNYPDLTDGQISKLVGTTRNTINAVRDRTHWNINNISLQNPAYIGLCSSAELEKAIALARAKAGTVASDMATDNTPNQDPPVTDHTVAAAMPANQFGTDTPITEKNYRVQDVFDTPSE